MSSGFDASFFAKLIGVFLAALILINAFEFLREDITAGTLRTETAVLLALIVVIAVTYWAVRRRVARERT